LKNPTTGVKFRVYMAPGGKYSIAKTEGMARMRILLNNDMWSFPFVNNVTNITHYLLPMRLAGRRNEVIRTVSSREAAMSVLRELPGIVDCMM